MKQQNIDWPIKMFVQVFSQKCLAPKNWRKIE